MNVQGGRPLASSRRAWWEEGKPGKRRADLEAGSHRQLWAEEVKWNRRRQGRLEGLMKGDEEGERCVITASQ